RRGPVAVPARLALQRCPRAGAQLGGAGLVCAPPRRGRESVNRKGLAMAKNIYVGNLVWDATQDDLYTLFQEYGTVTRAQVIMDKETGRSRGFGFVEMN